MIQSIVKLNKNEIKFLNALLEAGHKSDTEIAQVIKTSKATAGRIRKKLESDAVLQDYIPIIDLTKFGLGLYVVVSFEWKNFENQESTKKMENEFTETPQVVYFSNGDGSENLNYVAMLGFYDLNDYHAFFNEFRKKFQKHVGKLQTFFILPNQIKKQDFTDLAKFLINSGVKL